MIQPPPKDISYIPMGSKVAPGDKIGSTQKISAGKGCYVRGKTVYSCTVGTLVLRQESQQSSIPKKIEEEKEVVEDDQLLQTSSQVFNHNQEDQVVVAYVELEEGRHYASSQIYSIGHKVLAKVIRITNNMAMVKIVAGEEIGSTKEHHGGVIRKEDIRAGATEEIRIYDSFRPGDIVKARIISLGDFRRYYLSTAEKDLGVIRAKSSKSGEIMVPISWREMECAKTKTKELRKCAKI